MARIDAHVHVFAPASRELPRQVDDILPAGRGETAEKLLAEMEAHDVGQAVLVQIGGTALEHHAYLRHCVRAYPDRFLGIGLVPAGAPDPADHMDRLAGEGGIIGFRLSDLSGPGGPSASGDIRSLPVYPIWRRAAEADYVLWLYPREIDAALVPRLLEAFPQVRVVFNHLMVCPGAGRFHWDAKGRPQVDVPMPPPSAAALGVPLEGPYPFPNACVHLSGQYAFSGQPWPYPDLAAWHRRLLAAFGPGRLMWATDFPWITADPGYDRLVTVLDRLLPELTAEDRAAIMGGTAQRFLRFPARR
ncbi:MAG: amidohydrolase family protein [Gemmatimonadota bacterium]